MKLNRAFLFFIILLIISLKVSAQNDTISNERLFLERYTTAWVKDVNGYLDAESKPSANKQLAGFKVRNIRLYIPPNPNITMPNGNRYIAAYLINNTKDSVSISRADATLSGIQTEIKLGNEWKLFQINMGSSCGNSYYSMKLAPGNYLSLQIENRVVGNKKVKYRVIAYVGKKRIVSNDTDIYVSNDLIKVAGTPIKPLSL